MHWMQLKLDCLVRTVKEETDIFGKALYIPLHTYIDSDEVTSSRV
jgi:hypothetical protein